MIDNLLNYLDFPDGFFIEAGANDGVSQSNSHWFETNRNWKGLLVEPNKTKSEQCRNARPNSIVENYALVSSTYDKDTIFGDFNHQDGDSSLMAMTIDDQSYFDDAQYNHMDDHKKRFQIVEVPAIALHKLLQKHNITNIDFLSLDVEGYELSVLDGLNLTINKPRFIIVETANMPERSKAMCDYLTSFGYEYVERITGNDDFYKLRQ